jgi:hypothetical protein
MQEKLIKEPIERKVSTSKTNKMLMENTLALPNKLLQSKI